MQGPLMFVNPLTFFIQAERAVIFDDQLPQVFPTVAFGFASVLALLIGNNMYRLLKTGFADVI